MVTTNNTRLLLRYPPFADRAQCISQTAVNAIAAVAAAPYKLFALLSMAGSLAMPSEPCLGVDVPKLNNKFQTHTLRRQQPIQKPRRPVSMGWRSPKRQARSCSSPRGIAGIQCTWREHLWNTALAGTLRFVYNTLAKGLQAPIR